MILRTDPFNEIVFNFLGKLHSVVNCGAHFPLYIYP